MRVPEQIAIPAVTSFELDLTTDFFHHPKAVLVETPKTRRSMRSDESTRLGAPPPFVDDLVNFVSYVLGLLLVAGFTALAIYMLFAVIKLPTRKWEKIKMVHKDFLNRRFDA
jgi:hypothetical protein